MTRLVAAVLALVCNALLVLPPGWCCMVAPTPFAPVKSCCCCGCQSRPDPQRDEKPKPPDPSKCWCADRNASNPHDQHPDLPPPAQAAPVLVPAAPAADLFAGSADHPAPPPSIAAHVLDCVWLC